MLYTTDRRQVPDFLGDQQVQCLLVLQSCTLQQGKAARLCFMTMPPKFPAKCEANSCCIKHAGGHVPDTCRHRGDHVFQCQFQT